MKKLVLFLAFVLFGFGAQTTTVTSAWTTVCDSNISGYTNVIFQVHNTGSNPFTDCRVLSWVGPAVGDWDVISIDWAACKALVAGEMSYWEISSTARNKLRVQVQSTVGTTCYCKTSGTKG